MDFKKDKDWTREIARNLESFGRHYDALESGLDNDESLKAEDYPGIYNSTEVKLKDGSILYGQNEKAFIMVRAYLPAGVLLVVTKYADPETDSVKSKSIMFVPYSEIKWIESESFVSSIDP